MAVQGGVGTDIQRPFARAPDVEEPLQHVKMSVCRGERGVIVRHMVGTFGNDRFEYVARRVVQQVLDLFADKPRERHRIFEISV